MAKIVKAAQMRSPSKDSEPELDWEDQTPGDSKVGCTGSLGQGHGAEPILGIYLDFS